MNWYDTSLTQSRSKTSRTDYTRLILKQRWERTGRVAAYFSPLSPHTLLPARLIVIKGERRGADGLIRKYWCFTFLIYACILTKCGAAAGRPSPLRAAPPPLPAAVLSGVIKKMRVLTSAADICAAARLCN